MHVIELESSFLLQKKDNVMQELSQLLSSLLVNIALSSSVEKS